MFEAVELGRKVEKKRYERDVPGLRFELLTTQFDLRGADFPVVLVLSGDDRPGFEDAVDVLHEWMDPRYLEGHALGAPTDEERERPEFWRYWRTLPRCGRIAVYAGGWTLRAIRDRLGGRIKKAEFERALERIKRFEQALVADGVLVLKYWLHLDKKAHAKRVRKAERDPQSAWEVNEVDRSILESYDRAVVTAEHAIRKTSTVEAPWTILESKNRRYRNLELGRQIVTRLRSRLDRGTPRRAPRAVVPARSIVEPDGSACKTVLDTVDLERRVDKPVYDDELAALQARLSRESRRAFEEKRTSVLVFEGWDAAGKGGVVRRMVRAMSALHVRVIPIAAPTEEERAHHYLWRFWMRLPRAGRTAIFDRSWYGRVLVERVEGFATPDEWMRAYGEINEFEEQLVEHGILLQKYWLHVDPDEQLRRFEQRQRTPFKKYKITEEDWRNRDKWGAYAEAVDDMVARTSTEFAPWRLIPANDKRFARLAVMRAFVEALEAR